MQATQHATGARTVVVVSSEGVLTLAKARPVDCLAQLLDAGLREPLDSFFKSYGQEEAAAMCLILATSALPCAAAAAAAYEDAALVGEPWVDDELVRSLCPMSHSCRPTVAPYHTLRALSLS